MHQNDDGRFCLSCNKTVVDFTHKSKEEIIDLFTEAGYEVTEGTGLILSGDRQVYIEKRFTISVPYRRTENKLSASKGMPCSFPLAC